LDSKAAPKEEPEPIARHRRRWGARNRSREKKADPGGLPDSAGWLAEVRDLEPARAAALAPTAEHGPERGGAGQSAVGPADKKHARGPSP
jgi:hypothetical protein